MQPDTQQGTDALVAIWLATSLERRAAMEAQALVTFRERYDMQGTAETILKLFEMAKAKRA